MKLQQLLLCGAFAASLVLPIASEAQQAPATGASAAPAEARQGHHDPMRMLQGLNLTDSQKSQVQQIVTTYRQAHPEGSAPDPAARKAMRDQIMNVLTPDQQTQLKARMQKAHAEHQNEANEPSPSPAPSSR